MGIARIAVLAAMLAGTSSAQCVMCFRTAHAQNQARARVLNAGILVLGAPPILLFAGLLAFVAAKNRAGE